MMLKLLGKRRLSTGVEMTSSLFEGKEMSELYSKFRPIAPQSLIRELLQVFGGERLGVAVDVGCGSGQFTKLLIPHAKSVIGFDVSSSQLKEAREKIPDTSVEFRKGFGENLDLEENSVDLVSCCQTLHWLQVNKFYSEAERILAPGGVLAIIGYSFTAPETGEKCEEVREAMMRVYRTTAPYWSQERALVDAAYTTIPRSHLPHHSRSDSHYTDIIASVEDYAGYISSWSGYQTMRKKLGNAESEKVVSDFVAECLILLGQTGKKPCDVMLQLRTKFWLITYKKD